MEERNYTVYMHKNKINGKVYIGITKRKPQYRWNDGKGYKNQYFKRAIKKYGFDNFEHKILYKNLTQKEAEQKEIELISYYKSSERDFGYNISKGGMVNNGVPCKEETKQKISKANRGTKNGMYGKHHTEKEKEKISKASKKLWENKKHREKMLKILNKSKHDFPKGHIPWNKGMKGVRLSNYGFEKGHVPPFKGKKVPYEIYEHRCKKVICVETGEIFKSVNEAQRMKKCSNISQVCKGIRILAGGYHWRYYEE